MDKIERRRYFRIHDMVYLSYRPVNAVEGADYRDDVSNIEIEATRVISALNHELNKALDTLWESHAQVANVLSIFNRKLDFLAADLNPAFVGDQNQGEEMVRVDLSACGMAFQCAEYFSTGQQLNIELRLRPSGSLLQLVGLVIGCTPVEETSEKAYLLRVDFTGMGASTQEMLIQHIVKRQSSQVGEERTRKKRPG